jgi:hypothetical protein
MFDWNVTDVPHMQLGKYIFSDSFCVDGYFFRLQAGKVDQSSGNARSIAFALFLSLDAARTGVVSQYQHQSTAASLTQCCATRVDVSRAGVCCCSCEGIRERSI